MSVLGYSTCRIQFTPNGGQATECNYSDRSVVELRGSDDFSLRAVDVENGNAEIFTFPLENRNLYQFGKSFNQPDEIRSSNGTYYLWLAGESRQKFHEIFSVLLDALFPEELMDTSNKMTDSTTYSFTDSNTYSLPDKPEPNDGNAKDILMTVHNLSRHIKQGNDNEAARIAGQLASQRVHLQTKSLKRLEHEEEFQILVQFDGIEYSIDQNGGTIPIRVFHSTTIRELRAAFEFAYHYSPTSQYFFVNGNLAHDDSSMRDLMVGPNSLFVLFLLTHSKKFNQNGAWKCSTCRASNQQNNLTCTLCKALRIE